MTIFVVGVIVQEDVSEGEVNTTHERSPDVSIVYGYRTPNGDRNTQENPEPKCNEKKQEWQDTEMHGRPQEIPALNPCPRADLRREAL